MRKKPKKSQSKIPTMEMPVMSKAAYWLDTVPTERFEKKEVCSRVFIEHAHQNDVSGSPSVEVDWGLKKEGVE